MVGPRRSQLQRQGSRLHPRAARQRFSADVTPARSAAHSTIQSNQPQMSGQVSEIHTFGPNTVNQFNGSALFYAAVFVPSDPSGALAALPTFVAFAGTPFSPRRRVGRAALSPRLLLSPGTARFPVSDPRRHSPTSTADTRSARASAGCMTTSPIWISKRRAARSTGRSQLRLPTSITAAGRTTTLTQAFPSSPEAGLVFNTFGGYVADDWKVNDRLTVSLNLRLENYADPTLLQQLLLPACARLSTGPAIRARLQRHTTR